MFYFFSNNFHKFTRYIKIFYHYNFFIFHHFLYKISLPSCQSPLLFLLTNNFYFLQFSFLLKTFFPTHLFVITNFSFLFLYSSSFPSSIINPNQQSPPSIFNSLLTHFLLFFSTLQSLPIYILLYTFHLILVKFSFIFWNVAALQITSDNKLCTSLIT